MIRRTVLAAVLAAAAVLPALPASAATGTTVTGTYTNAYGSRFYRGYVPSTYRAGTPIPLVVVLHGCTQTSADAESGTRFSTVAESRGFAVVYPEQSTAANGARCWNWFQTINQVRGQYEPSLIAGITAWVKSQYTIDAKRVYITGLSAGAGMSVIMGATYPDVYAAIGSNAGCEYGGYPCGTSGGPNPVTQGQAAYNASGAFHAVVPAIVFQGDKDTTVPPVNAEQAIQQWISTNDYADDGSHNGSVPTTRSSTSSGSVTGGYTYDIDYHRNAAGSNLEQRYLIHGMGHAYSGGSTAGSYTDAKGPDATNISVDFFLAHPKP
jgi:poly(hydroxyalkanoate) depolymerase family esterase